MQRGRKKIVLSKLAKDNPELARLQAPLERSRGSHPADASLWTRRFAASGKPCRPTFQDESWTSRFEASEKRGKIDRAEDPAVPGSLA
jgi:hypothetical protein